VTFGSGREIITYVFFSRARPIGNVVLSLGISFCLYAVNEAPRSKLRGIKAEFAQANPPSLFRLRRVRRAILSRDGAFSEGRSSLQQAAGCSGEGE